MGFDYDIQDNNEGRGMINMIYESNRASNKTGI